MAQATRPARTLPYLVHHSVTEDGVCTMEGMWGLARLACMRRKEAINGAAGLTGGDLHCCYSVRMRERAGGRSLRCKMWSAARQDRRFAATSGSAVRLGPLRLFLRMRGLEALGAIYGAGAETRLLPPRSPLGGGGGGVQSSVGAVMLGKRVGPPLSSQHPALQQGWLALCNATITFRP